ncbi:(Lyso)-N-acylphosphatidylethanolamine lipase isoform X1 [Anastrepha ludens]|uniref:(Lyso)-N-acylphosphatidylethanolamine lipase isoform X1 n=2 Tax=Anastrepha ludens TaxID=28586 RepID=UPI0023B0C85E|nr:(Lyso)-N-acylphosphatidylethanolamine lipase isoform X1 [Anastrepha ludens]
MSLATSILHQSQSDSDYTLGQKAMDIEERKSESFWLWKWVFNWTSSSPIMLRAVEKKILSFLKTPYRGFFVDIGPAIGEADKIWTVSLNTDSKEVPLVMLHGLGAGVALWVMNLDALAKDRPVYAMDVLGFGRSSRPNFSNDALVCEKQFVKSVEEWRREMNINSMILLGHSMGGFVASSYALSYPDRVNHLILADPWGFPEKPADGTNTRQLPLWVRAIAYALTPLNPLWALRAAGPLGQWVVEKTRPDIMRKFSAAVEEDNNLLPHYIHQCNAQTPSGESAFHTMMTSFGWAKHPMVHRAKDVREGIPITFIYGSRSWIDSSSGEKIKAQRPDSRVDIKMVSGAGHHVYADKPDVFNRYVNEACKIFSKDSDLRDSTESDEEQKSTSAHVEARQQQELNSENTVPGNQQQTDEVVTNIKPQ